MTAHGREVLYAIADKGRFSGAEILACHEAGIATTMSRPVTSASRSKGIFVKADFHCKPDRDACRCPAGKQPTYRYTREEDGLMVARHWINGCPHCSLQPR